MWESPDPILGTYLNGQPNGGLYNPANLAFYDYAYQNPIRYQDPDGRCPVCMIGILDAGELGAGAAGAVGGGYQPHRLNLNAPIFTPSIDRALARNLSPYGAWERIKTLVTTPGKAWDNFQKNTGLGHILTAESSESHKPNLVEPDRARHILEGDATGGGHRAGSGKAGKSEFPADWSDEKILGHTSDVATDPASSRSQSDKGRQIIEGTREGIDIRVITEGNGKIVTGYPTNVTRNPRSP